MKNTMEQITRLIRPNILTLTPYSCARMEYEGDASIFIDANENPYETSYNRYPDPQQIALKQQLAKIRDVSIEQIVVGNGSDELIDLLIRVFCEPTIDFIVNFTPGYGMYKVSARVSNVEVKDLTLTTDLQPDWLELNKIITPNCKLVFLCTPNNPIGNEIPLDDIANFASSFEGIVVVDEAYIDFGSNPSTITLLEQFPNIIVLQTLSKAWGLAGLRLGALYANPYIVQIINRVKPPYNVSCLSQEVALKRLLGQEQFESEVNSLKEQREMLFEELKKLSYIDKVYESQANFVLIESIYSEGIFATLLAAGIVVRKRHIPPRIIGGLRFTVGTSEENEKLLTVLKTWKPQ